MSCWPEPLQTRVPARGERLCILGTPTAAPWDPCYSLISIPAVTGADEEPRSEAEWDHGMGCCSLGVMGFVWGHMSNLGWRGTTRTCWKSSCWLSFLSNLQACCAGGSRKGVSFWIALLKWKISQGIMVLQEKCEHKCSSHMKIRCILHWHCPLASSPCSPPKKGGNNLK